MNRRRMLLAGACLAPVSALVGGCAGFGWRPTRTPMDTLAAPLEIGRRAETLIVFLPGAYDKPQDFVTEGFVDEVRRRALPADLLMVDAHVGYYRERTLEPRLNADVIVPAREQGYREIWLVGISLGGLGAFLYAASGPGVDGIVALAPFVGTREVIGDLREAGGIRAWQPGTLGDDDWERRMLRWLRGYYTEPQLPGRPALVVGWGEQDRFADSLSVVFADQPAATRFTVPGGHDWKAWRTLWQRILDAHGTAIGGRVLA